MRIRFDPDFDTGSWPGPLGTADTTKDAVAGEAWVGPTGILALLETELGLSGDYPSLTKRAATLVPHLRATDGYWSRSLSVDALGTATKLIADRDALRSWGWNGEPVSDRLTQLYTGTKPVEPGIPDRFDAVMHALSERKPTAEPISLEVISLTDPRATLPPQLSQLVDRLESLGVKVEERVPIAAPHAATDLAAAREADLHPSGDNTLQLVRPYGPVQAAEDLAAWLSARPSLEDVVIIGPDAILDRALTKFGLPTTGQAEGAAELSAALPLALELGWHPQDPQHAYELLLLPDGPVRKSVSRNLVRALQNWPSTEASDWETRLTEALERIEGEKDRQRVAARVEALFARGAARSSDRCTVDGLKDRIASVESWARGRASSIESSGDTEDQIQLIQNLHAVAAHCQALSGLLSAAKIDGLSAADLRRWVSAAAPPDRASLPARAGLSWVRSPTQIVESSPTIVWWSFTRSSAPPIRWLDLTHPERQALVEVGVTPPDAGDLALLRAARWNRPLRLASKTLLLISPRHDDGGTEDYPHPLWDEICGRVPESQSVDPLIQRLPVGEPEPSVTTKALHPFPTPTRQWAIPRGVTLEREGESPSSIEKLLGCPFQWAIDKFTRVRSGLASPPNGPSPLLAGSVAHQLLHELATAGGLGAEDGPAQMAALFDARIGQLAAPYVLPGADGERTDLRHQLVETVKVLSAAIRSSGAVVVGSEEEVSGELFGQKIFGRLDLLLRPPGLVIDYKYGGRDDRNRELQSGTAMQLVLYANLLGEGKEPVHLSYVILRSQEILTTLPGIQEAVSVHGPPNEISLASIGKAFELRRAEFAEGNLVAAGIAEEGDDAVAVIASRSITPSGALEMPPGCRYCDSSALCGRAWRNENG